MHDAAARLVKRSWGVEASAAVQEEGGTAAGTTIDGLCGPGDDLYSLRRVVVGSEMTFWENNAKTPTTRFSTIRG